MKVFEGKDISLKNKSVVAIGKFDAFHIGHREILKTLVKEAKLAGDDCLSVAVTFMPLPDVYFGKSDKRNLFTYDDKLKMFERAGIDAVCILPFDEETVHMSADSFIRNFLKDRLNCVGIVGGEDISFGFMGEGNREFLIANGEKYGLQTIICPEVYHGGEVISSSLIRKNLENANIGAVNEMLGFPYHIGAIVEKGKHLGTRLGFPTVNFKDNGELFLPGGGVYLTVSKIDAGGESFFYPSMTNVGVRPTVSESGEITVETYISGVDEDLYGDFVTVYFVEFLRNEVKFDSTDELTAQLKKDKDEVEAFDVNAFLSAYKEKM